MASHTKWIKAIASSALTEEQMDIIDRLHREEQAAQVPPPAVKLPIYWVTVEGIGRVHQGRDYNRARSIYGEYCAYSRQASGSLAGLDVTMVRDGIEVLMYFSPRPYNMG